MDSITLLELRTSIITEASIQGQTGTNGRHQVADLNVLINRYCREVRSLAADAGAPWFQTLGPITTPIPAPVSGEDFIEVPFPANALEILGVDVSTNQGGCVKFGELDEADWTQRRLLNFGSGLPEGGLGWWAVESMAEARDASTVTAGVIALFPSSLTGSYRITFREQFTTLTQDTSLFVGIVSMFTWVINACVLAITKGDNNKKNNYAAAEKEFARAEARILKACKRTQSAGAIVPKRVGGELF